MHHDYVSLSLPEYRDTNESRATVSTSLHRPLYVLLGTNFIIWNFTVNAVAYGIRQLMTHKLMMTWGMTVKRWLNVFSELPGIRYYLGTMNSFRFHRRYWCVSLKRKSFCAGQEAWVIINGRVLERMLAKHLHRMMRVLMMSQSFLQMLYVQDGHL